MTNKQKEAFETAARVSEGEQDALAAAILEEIESDARRSFQTTFEISHYQAIPRSTRGPA